MKPPFNHGLKLMSQTTPDYVPGPEHPPSPVYVPYVPEPAYPECWKLSSRNMIRDGLKMASSHDFNEIEEVLQEDRSKGNQDSKRRDAGNTGYIAKDNRSNSGLDTEVKSCSKECVESYAKLKKLYDDQREQLGDASIEIQAYTQALKKVEAQLVGHQKNKLWYKEKIRFMKIDLEDKTDVLTYHKKLLAEAMSNRDKSGLGYGDQVHEGVLSYENEVFQSVFDSRLSDVEDSLVHDRFANIEGMHAVPPPMTGNYIPLGPDREVDDSIVETLKSMPEPVVVEPKVVSQPKVWSDAPIIKEYELDSDDEYVIQPSKEQERPSFAFVNTVKHVKTHRETIKEQNIYSLSLKADKRDWNVLMSKKLGLGYGFTKKACFVCGSFSHLIRDCDFHEKRMAKQVELNKKKGKGTGQVENRLVWNNVQRLNHQNKFVPKAVLTKTGIFPVNTARQNLSSQAVTTSTARKVNTARPIVNEIRPRNNFYKSHSPIRRPFNRTTAPKAKFSNQKVNSAEVKEVSVVRGIWETADNLQRALKNKGIMDSGYFRHMTGNKAYLAEYQDYNGGPVAFGGSKGYITGKEFKNMDIIEFYGSKGIKREYSNARTPQQNGVAERKNRTLIEAARTMLADLFLPNTFWAEAPVRSENQANKTAEKSSKAKNEGEKHTKDTGLKTNEEPVDQEDQAFLEDLKGLKDKKKRLMMHLEGFLESEFAQSTRIALPSRAAKATSTNNTVNTVMQRHLSLLILQYVFSIGGHLILINQLADQRRSECLVFVYIDFLIYHCMLVNVYQFILVYALLYAAYHSTGSS
ncbi:ribonuclease H-like domain-containing protein [Tanacetum coccineum]